MKNNLKRILVLFLASSMIAGAAACTESKDSTESNPGADNVSVVTDEAEEQEETRIPDDLPAVNYDGEEYMLYIGGHTYDDFDYVEDKAGDLMNDAVYARNLHVEERLNIRLSTYTMGASDDVAGPNKLIHTLVEAGDNTMDIIASGQVFLAPLTYDSILIDWNTLDHVNLGKPWWDDGILEQANFANKVLMTTGDIVTSSLSMTGILLFNKQLMVDNNMTYPYQLVLDGKWTYEQFMTYVTVMLNDLNGDGKYTCDDDMWGFTGWCCETGPNLAASMGMKYLTKDSDGLPSLAIYSERNNDVIQKICDLFSDGTGAYDNHTGWGPDMTMFKENRVLFEDSRFILLNNFRDMDADFGIIPHPKYDELQEKYYQRVSDVGSVVVLPISNNHLEETSVVLEAMASESYYEVTPVYFDVVLSVKSTRDEDSPEMLSLIRESKMFNPIISGWGTEQFQAYTRTGKNTFASNYSSAEKKLNREIEKIITAFTAE